MILRCQLCTYQAIKCTLRGHREGNSTSKKVHDGQENYSRTKCGWTMLVKSKSSRCLVHHEAANARFSWHLVRAGRIYNWFLIFAAWVRLA